MRRRQLSIAIPASIVSDIPHLREKTAKIGSVGRAASIFRVDEIIVYQDKPHLDQSADLDLITTLLRYLETPQYLRKRLFKLKRELRYVGILPPLRTPHHPLRSRSDKLTVGEYREGVVVAKEKTGVLLDIGLRKPVLVPRVQLPVGSRRTVRISKSARQVRAKIVSRDEVPQYWGYVVSRETLPFGGMVKKREFGLSVATSRHGKSFAEVQEELVGSWRTAGTILVGFGAPAQGLHEITKRERLDLNEIVDFVVNTIPMQGTDTIRTEEAIMSSLAVFNMQVASYF